MKKEIDAWEELRHALDSMRTLLKAEAEYSSKNLVGMLAQMDHEALLDKKYEEEINKREKEERDAFLATMAESAEREMDIRISEEESEYPQDEDVYQEKMLSLMDRDPEMEELEAIFAPKSETEAYIRKEKEMLADLEAPDCSEMLEWDDERER
jgi:hypothetical protein